MNPVTLQTIVLIVLAGPVLGLLFVTSNDVHDIAATLRAIHRLLIEHGHAEPSGGLDRRMAALQATRFGPSMTVTTFPELARHRALCRSDVVEPDRPRA